MSSAIFNSLCLSLPGILLAKSCCSASRLIMHLSVHAEQGSTYDRYVGSKITTTTNAHSSQHPCAEDEEGGHGTDSSRGGGRGIGNSKLHGTFNGSNSTRTRNMMMSSIKTEGVTATMSSLTRSLRINMTKPSRRPSASVDFPGPDAAGPAEPARPAGCSERAPTLIDMLEVEMAGSEEDTDDDDHDELKTTTHGATLPFPTSNLVAFPAAAPEEILEEKRKASTTVLKDLNFCSYHGSLLEKRLKEERAAAQRSKV